MERVLSGRAPLFCARVSSLGGIPQTAGGAARAPPGVTNKRPVRLCLPGMDASEERMNDLWGQDIALDAAGQARVAANGELVLTDGVETGVQDIKLRLFTRLGGLFYDLDFGSLITDWFYEDSTATTRAAFLAEVTMRVEADPRVVVGSVRTSLLGWDEKSITVAVQWRFIDEDQPLNLVLRADKSVRELVIRDDRYDEPEAAL